MTASAFARQQLLQASSRLSEQAEQFSHATDGLGHIYGRSVAGPSPVQRDQRLTLSKREAAELIGVSMRTLDRLIARRLISHVRGLPRRYSKAAIEAFVHGSSVARRTA
jgi:excisionase family DNA binding protein